MTTQMIKKMTLRFYMDNPLHRKAWELLMNRNQKEFKSVTDFIANSMVFYDDRIHQEDCIADVFVRKLLSSMGSMGKMLDAGMKVEIQPDEPDEKDMDWDFIGDDEE